MKRMQWSRSQSVSQTRACPGFSGQSGMPRWPARVWGRGSGVSGQSFHVKLGVQHGLVVQPRSIRVLHPAQVCLRAVEVPAPLAAASPVAKCRRFNTPSRSDQVGHVHQCQHGRDREPRSSVAVSRDVTPYCGSCRGRKAAG